MVDEAERRTERVPLLMTPSEVKALDDWAFANRIRSRGEAIRRLMEAGLSAQLAPKPKRSGSSQPRGDQDAGTGAPTPTRSRKAAPPAKAAAMSKSAQIRALRERNSQ